MTKRERCARAVAALIHKRAPTKTDYEITDAIIAELREPDDRMRAASTRLNHPTDDEIWFARLDAVGDE